MIASNRSFRVAAALATALGLASVAHAGPPLICHPFATDAGAELLPWAEGRAWRAPDASYDTANLVADTLELLSADAPFAARMENMRRATIYADLDPEIAAELLRAVVARTETAPAAAVEWFDAGFLVESYRQMDLVHEHGMLRSSGRPVSLVPKEFASLDGRGLVRQALSMSPASAAELQYAASLMSRE